MRTKRPGPLRESGEESEFLARAWTMEVEAVERYSMLADAMEEHNNPEVAELFRKLARIEQLHADGIVEQKESLRPQPALAAGELLWEKSEGMETADPGELHYRMQPYHALQMALAARTTGQAVLREDGPRCQVGLGAQDRARNGGGGGGARAPDRGLDQAHATARRRLGLRPGSTCERGLT